MIMAAVVTMSKATPVLLVVSANRSPRFAFGSDRESAAFLERAAMLTREPGRRAQRVLAGARAKSDAGALDAALGLPVAVEAGPLDAPRIAEVEHLRGQIAVMQRRASDAARLLLMVSPLARSSRRTRMTGGGRPGTRRHDQVHVLHASAFHPGPPGR